MSEFSPAQLREQRAIRRTGLTVKVIQDGAAGGIEKRYTGSEPGFQTVRALFKDKPYSAPSEEGDVDRLRGEADEARARHREKRLTVAYADLGFEPTERTRAVVHGKTYAVQHVDRKMHVDDTVSYTMALRPV